VRRVAPSTVIHEEIDRLLSRGTSEESNLLSKLAELGLRYLVQRASSALRAERGWSAQQLANKCAETGADYLNRDVITNIENHRRQSVSIDEVFVFAQVFKVAPAFPFRSERKRPVDHDRWH
jgi:hypothetical protein